MPSEQEQDNTEQAYVYIDGGSRGNPGPSAIGYIIKSSDKKVIAARAKYIGETTNNVAEYTALLFALKHASKLGVKNVLVRSDSKLVVKQLNGAWRIKNQRMIDLCSACRQAASDFKQFRIEHISRAQNTEADKKVRDALKAQKKKVESTSKCRFKADGIIYVAGASKGSPGHAAAAYVIVTPDDKVIAIHARYLGKRPQNIPEYAAVYLAAKNARALGLDKIIVRTDNTLVAKQLCGEFKVKSEKLKKPYADCAKALSGFGKHAIQIISRKANKITHRMASETIRDYEREEARKEAESKKGNPTSTAMVQDSELDS